jgi:hypothetical protein
MQWIIERYKIKPDNAQEHERLTVNVFEELRAKSPEGVRCLVLKLEDGSYVHSPRSTVSTRSKAGSRSCVLNRRRRAMRPLAAIIRGSRLTQQHENSGSAPSGRQTGRVGRWARETHRMRTELQGVRII